MGSRNEGALWHRRGQGSSLRTVAGLSQGKGQVADSRPEGPDIKCGRPSHTRRGHRPVSEQVSVRGREGGRDRLQEQECGSRRTPQCSARDRICMSQR